MTAVSPWAPPQGGTQQAPVPSPPPGTPPQYRPPFAPMTATPRPPRRGLALSLLVLGALLLIIAAIAATAAITYSIARNTAAPTATPTPSPAPAAPQFSAAEQNAAKQQVCQVFDDTTRGSMSQGAMRTNGQTNLLPLIRTVNSVLAVEKSLTPATPADVRQAAQRFIDADLKVATAATNGTPTDDFNRLNDAANDAIYAFADVCGLPH